MLNHRSGLLGLSGRSGDLRELQRVADAGDLRAERALTAFSYRVRKYIGAYAAALGGLDAIGFAGGIGEHAVAMRARICEGLDFLGIRIDSQRNRDAIGGNAPRQINAVGATVQMWVVPTDEETQIARELYELLR